MSRASKLRGFLCALGLLGSGCGVWFGDPIELFPDRRNIDGGIDYSSACLEQSSRLSGNALTIIDVPARNLQAMVEGTRTADLDWPSAASTQVSVTMSGVRVFSVYSRVNPSSGKRREASECANHVRIEGDLTLKTLDGKLDETRSGVSFIAYEGSEAQASFTLQSSELKGAYKPSSLGSRCYASTEFSLLAAYDGIHGNMVDTLDTSCEDAAIGAPILRAGGNWGDRWQH